MKKISGGCIKSSSSWDTNFSLLSKLHAWKECYSKTFCFTSFSSFMMNLCVKSLIKDIIMLNLSVMNCLWHLLVAKWSQSLSVSVYILLHYLLLNSHPFQIDLAGCNFPPNCSFIWVTNINRIHNPWGVHAECSNVKNEFLIFNIGMEQKGSPWEPTLQKALCIRHCT